MVANLAEAKTHPITPEDFLAFDSAIRTSKREMEDAAAALARSKKAAKDGAVNLKAYKMLEALRRLDEDEHIIVLRALWQMVHWLEMPVGTQFSLMDAPQITPAKAKAKEQHSVWAAGEAGLKAGRMGAHPDENPHISGTEQHVAYATKHRAGLEERATASHLSEEGRIDTVDDIHVTTAKRGRTRTGRATARSLERARDRVENGQHLPN